MINPKLDEDTFIGLINATELRKHWSPDPLAGVLSAGLCGLFCKAEFVSHKSTVSRQTECAFFSGFHDC